MPPVTETAKPGLPIQAPASQDSLKSDKNLEDGMLRFLQTRSFIFWYRSRYRPASAYVLAESLEIARDRAERYCERFQLRFISVHPMYLDLDKRSEESKGDL